MGREVLADAFVERFVASADQPQLIISGKLTRHLLIETFALRAKQDNRTGWRSPQDTFNCRENGLGFHHHSPAAAVRRVVGGVVFVGCPVADVVGLDVNQAILYGTLEDAYLKIRLKNLRKEAENVKSHKRILDESRGMGKLFGSLPLLAFGLGMDFG